MLFATVTDPHLIVLVQVLDGITAAMLGVMVPLIIADLTRGTGRFNLAQGVIGTMTGHRGRGQHHRRRLPDGSFRQPDRISRAWRHRRRGLASAALVLMPETRTSRAVSAVRAG